MKDNIGRRTRKLVSAGARRENIAAWANPCMVVISVHYVLNCTPAHSLCKSSFNLTNINRWIDTGANVYDDIGEESSVVTSQNIDFHFGVGNSLREVVERVPLPRILRSISGEISGLLLEEVISDTRVVRSVKAMGGHINAFHVSSVGDFRQACFRSEFLANRLQTDKNLTAGIQRTHAIKISRHTCSSRNGVGYLVRTAFINVNILYWDSKSLGSDLTNLCMQTLAHLGAAMGHKHGTVSVKMDERSTCKKRKGSSVLLVYC